MEVRVFHLRPLSPFHLGEATGAMDRVSEIAHSDTVFSGLCHAWCRLYGARELESLLSALSGDKPPLLLSSAFPYRSGSDGATVYYLPWPRGGELSLRFRDRKMAKRTNFLPLPLFEKLFVEPEGRESAGLSTSTREVGEEEENALREDAKCLGEGIRVETRINSALCRKTMSAAPYHLAVLRFAAGWGLYLLAEGEEGWLDRAEGALRLLGDMGLGGDRSSGCGAFELERGDFSPFEKLMAAKKSCYMALSLVFPGPGERNALAGSRISLLERKGWIDSPELRISFRKKRTVMIAEGSVLTSRVKGELVDVTPRGWTGHRIYRYGIGFYLPVGF